MPTGFVERVVPELYQNYIHFQRNPLFQVFEILHHQLNIQQLLHPKEVRY